MNENHNIEKSYTQDLIKSVRAGDEAAFEKLLGLYRPMLSAMLGKYIIDGSDPDDARQEALAGFYRAILSFDLAQPNVAFGLYAKICVSNALISHLREIIRRTEGNAENIDYEDYLKYCTDSSPDPAERVIEKESTEELKKLIRENLSDYENKVWNMYTAGNTTPVIAKRLSKPEKSIDNALYRIRAKLRTLLESYGNR